MYLSKIYEEVSDIQEKINTIMQKRLNRFVIQGIMTLVENNIQMSIFY